jgi:hypothetical protein
LSYGDFHHEGQRGSDHHDRMGNRFRRAPRRMILPQFSSALIARRQKSHDV